MKPDRMLRIALTEFRKTPRLQECDPLTVLGSIVVASQLGLEPGSGLGHCFLVPYWNKNNQCFECQLIPGYKGFVELARRSGQVTEVYSRAVYQKDSFEYEYGLDESLIHKPAADSDRGQLTHVYAVVKYKNGGRAFEVMSVAEVVKVRDGLRNRNPIWESHFDEMARKTVVRRLAKYMPLSPEFVQLQELDDVVNDGASQGNHAVIDAEYEPRYQLSDQATTPAEIYNEQRQEGEREAWTKASEAVQKRIEAKIRAGALETDIMADAGLKSIRPDWSQYTAKQLAAMLQALK